MTLWKAWSDVRRRFYLAVVLITLMMAPGAIALAVSAVRAKAAIRAAGGAADPALQGAADAFAHSLRGWIGGDAHLIFAILAVVLAVGGTMSRSEARSNLMTLSLPERRSRWLTDQWLVACGLVLALCAWEAAIMAVTGAVAGLEVPLGRLLQATFLTSLSAALWVWPGMLATSYTRDAVRAALIVVSIMVALRTFSGLAGTRDWSFAVIADVGAWTGAVPWRPLLAGVAMTAACGWLVVRRFERAEY